MFSVIIPASGKGSRMNTKVKKQFIDLDGKPIIIRTIEKFLLKEITEIIVVIDKRDEEYFRTLLSDYNINNIMIAYGGTLRQDSIKNGLKKVTNPYVMVHDGVRPFINQKIIREHMEMIEYEDALITAVPSVDTIKLACDGYVEKTLDRSKLINVQTPQSFKTAILKSCYENVKKEYTDDSFLVEDNNYKIKIVEGDYTNIKITTDIDLIIGEMILKNGK